jgi:hypothetical protein
LNSACATGTRQCSAEHDIGATERRSQRQSSPGTMRRIYPSNSGTVNAVSPWLGLQIMPLRIS